MQTPHTEVVFDIGGFMAWFVYVIGIVLFMAVS